MFGNKMKLQFSGLCKSYLSQSGMKDHFSSTRINSIIYIIMYSTIKCNTSHQGN